MALREDFVAFVRAAAERQSPPLFVGIDGRSGAGKSTLAASAVEDLSAVSIEGDQFYTGGSAATWDRRSTQHMVDLCIDWRLQHHVLTQLRADGVAEWHPFDWHAENWDSDDARFAKESIRTEIAPVVLLEGAYSCRPELHELLDVRVLLTAPTVVRTQRVRDRSGGEYQADWERRWIQGEDLYFGSIMPPERFDLVLDAG